MGALRRLCHRSLCCGSESDSGDCDDCESERVESDRTRSGGISFYEKPSTCVSRRRPRLPDGTQTIVSTSTVTQEHVASSTNIALSFHAYPHMIQASPARLPLPSTHPLHPLHLFLPPFVPSHLPKIIPQTSACSAARAHLPCDWDVISAVKASAFAETGPSALAPTKVAGQVPG